MRVGRGPTPTAPDHRREQTLVTGLLRAWSGDPIKAICVLGHHYTPAELAFAALKGADAAMTDLLARAAPEADCTLHLAMVSIEESGAAEYNGEWYGRRGRWRDDDPDVYEVVEVTDRVQKLTDWRQPTDEPGALGPIPYRDDELCPHAGRDEDCGQLRAPGGATQVGPGEPAEAVPALTRRDTPGGSGSQEPAGRMPSSQDRSCDCQDPVGSGGTVVLGTPVAGVPGNAPKFGFSAAGLTASLNSA